MAAIITVQKSRFLLARLVSIVYGEDSCACDRHPVIT